MSFFWRDADERRWRVRRIGPFTGRFQDRECMPTVRALVARQEVVHHTRTGASAGHPRPRQSRGWGVNVADVAVGLGQSASGQASTTPTRLPLRRLIAYALIEFPVGGAMNATSLFLGFHYATLGV